MAADVARNAAATADGVSPADASRMGFAFTCLACQVAFKSAEHQRDHYRSDWHRYNLKRKVADLPPVTQENFALRLSAQQVKANEETARSSFSAECAVCRKVYSSENAYSNHLNSKKHKEAEAKGPREQKATPPPSTAAPEVSTSSSSSSSAKPLPWKVQLATAKTEEEINAIIDRKVATAPRLAVSDCLFCDAHLGSLEENMEHMAKTHSFFVPDLEYLVDLEGLVKYLGEKISVGNVCLYCNGKGKSFYSLESVRMHMLEKGHCKIPYEEDDDLDEVAEFYDFSSTWDDQDGGGDDAEGEEEEAVDGQGDWEDVDESVSATARVKRPPVFVSEDGTQLALGDGRVVLHRAVAAHQQARRLPDTQVVARVAGRYASLDVAAVRSRMATLALEREARKQNAQIQRSYDQFRTRVGVRGNRGYSNRFFRDQLGFLK
ncbi:hypothetical protein HK405_004039 [Cladochytrium tenue]|nr:hypothetical protein HK405_004039 [Cladochytrium tenue]